MESLMETIKCAQNIRQQLQIQRSAQEALVLYVKHCESKLGKKIQKFLVLLSKQSQVTQSLGIEIHEANLFILFERSYSGMPIIEELKQFEQELMEKYLVQSDSLIKALPYYLMIPCFLFYLPALIILLFGPFVLSISGEM